MATGRRSLVVVVIAAYMVSFAAILAVRGLAKAVPAQV
jgi:hypothetical protein